MKKLLLCFSAILLYSTSISFAQPLLWAHNAEGTSLGQSTCTDADGNVYVTGSFDSDSITFGTTILINANTNSSDDIFIVKYDPQGNVLWAKSAGGTYYEAGYGVTTDASGNVIVTGYFNSASIIFGTTTLTHNGTGYDIFIAKYDASGNVLWANSAGGTNNDAGQSISADADGNIYITGYFKSATITFGTTVLTNAGSGYVDIFTAKYDASGNIVWANSAGGTYDDYGESIAADAYGNVYITGYFKSNSLIVGDTTLTNVGNQQADILIVKYDTNGTMLWAKRHGSGNIDDMGYDIATDVAGNVLVTGYFGSIICYFDTITIENYYVQNLGLYPDIFTTKLDPSGHVIWAKSAGGGLMEFGYGICADVNGNVYVTGAAFSNPVHVEDLIFYSMGGLDVFFASYDALGNLRGADLAGGSGYDYGYDVTTDINGNHFVAGTSESPSIFNLTNTGTSLFVVKFSNVANACSASFTIYPDPLNAHNWFALITSTGNPPLTYIWNWGDGSTSVGSNPSHTYSTPGYYNICVTVSDGNGCSDIYCDNSTYIYKTDEIITVNVVDQLPVSISEKENNAIKIYPNPTSSSLTIETGQGKGIYQLQDVSGKIILQGSINAARYTLDISTLAKGIYVLTITDALPAGRQGDTQVHKKIVKE